MHGYAQKLDEKSELINKNMSVVKKIAYYYLGRVHQVVEVEDLLPVVSLGAAFVQRLAWILSGAITLAR